MKNLIFVFVALIIASCASTKTSKVVITPAGNWDYNISGTPEGDFSGVMSIVSENKLYSAKMTASGSEITIYKFTWDEPTMKVGGEFNYSNYTVLLDAALAGEEMVGTMSVEGMSFPFKATRKK
jgi:hypothetical protein